MIKKILISPGHGATTAGKRSPIKEDGTQLLEWEFNRKLAKAIASKLDDLGIPYQLLDMGATDVSLTGRAVEANRFGRDTLYISIHANAAGDGKEWNKANGWEAFTSKGETKSDEICEVFMEEADKLLTPLGYKIRKNSKTKMGKEENFTVLTKTFMPAILTENLFYTNKSDLKFMESDEGLDTLAQIHANAIRRVYGK